MEIKPNSKTKFNGILTNRILLKGLEQTARNGALVSAGTTLVLSSACRPLSILSTPNVDKTDKRYACAKSLASSVAGFGLMFAVTTPVSRAMERIDKSPEKYLNPNTIKKLSDGAKPLTASSAYKFVSQLFKLGSGVLTTYPKALMTAMFIPIFMASVFNKTSTPLDGEIPKPNKKTEEVSFKGGIITSLKNNASKITEGIASKMATIINNPSVQNFSKKYADTNLAQHIFSLTDITATAFCTTQIAKNKKIESDKKKTLILNSIIACGLTITGAYGVDKLLQKPTEKFIERFKTVNKNSPKLDKYIEGIKIAKPIIILGSLYYILIPFVSTFLADKFKSSGAKQKSKDKNSEDIRTV